MTASVSQQTFNAPPGLCLQVSPSLSAARAPSAVAAFKWADDLLIMTSCCSERGDAGWADSQVVILGAVIDSEHKRVHLKFQFQIFENWGRLLTYS